MRNPTLVERIEADLAQHGPMAFCRESFERYAMHYADPNLALGDVDRWGKPRAGRVVPLFELFGGATFERESVGVTLEQVGNVGCNGDGYVRVAAVGGKKLAKGQKIAVIPIMGPVTPFQAPAWYAEWGIRVAALPNIVSAARSAANDPDVGRIILAVHSPGGSAFGVGEAAASLRDVAKRKPMTAAITYLSASAAYWLTSAAGEIVAAPSAMVGSVGVVLTHAEFSKALEMEGVTVTEITNPPSKRDVSLYKPLSDTARAELQRTVDDIYADFAADISTARRIDMVKNADQYGRVHTARDALSIKMIDRVATFEALLVEAVPSGADMTATRRARLAIMQRQ